MGGNLSPGSRAEGVSFTLPCTPPSMNSMYGINYRTREVFLSREARDYKNQMKLFVPKFEVGDADQVGLEIEVTENWLTKQGKIKKRDVQNMVKILVDLISEKQQWGDEKVWKLTVSKVQSKERSVVSVREFILS